ncbi:hypothetical protein [Sporosarcina ureilytica]|uniref:VOC domain-containing protein n=1 Tax=Sporosarcina ureilytica TaxID=298596 RepID=A0A1D8JEM9_9BACL|nr:hypothetical protein [Sporosarcina ureilytica]AOV07174.1 hypothetical protein BI350_06220 [Sporosarcina ureilytica]
MFKSVTLYTDQLVEMKNFYHNLLEIPIIEKGKNFFTLSIGTSTLTFKQSEGNSIYHFAFNIPGNHLTSAKRWLTERVSLNKEDDKDEIFYKNFNADAIYFDDPSGNIVEYIGRRTVIHDGEFSIQSLINISEMSVTTPYVKIVGQQLMEIGIPTFHNQSLQEDDLNFLGMDDTYVVLVPPNRTWYFSDVKSKTDPLEIKFTSNREIIITKDGRLKLK